MEDDNGLELSLGLSCGGSLGKSKNKDVSSDLKVEEGSSNRSMGGNMTVPDPSFKSFFQTSTENQDPKGKQKRDPVLQQHENFWTDLGKCSAPVADRSNDVHDNLSQFTRYQDLWISNNKTTDSEEEKSGSNKRKLPFEEINFQDKHGKVVDTADTHGKNPTGVNLMRNSRVSITTEDVISGENEDAAESEAEGSNSWLVSQREDKSKCSDIPNFTDKHVLSDSSGTGPQGQKEPSVSGTESNHELGKVAYGIPLSLQPLTVMTVPYSVPVKVPTAASAPNATGFPPSCVMQLMPLANSECPVVQAVNTSNLQLAFGYSPVQLPSLETGSSWAFNSQPRHVTTFGSRDHADGASNSEHDDVKTSHVSVQAPHSSSAAAAYEVKSSDLVKGNGKHVGEVGTSSQTEDEGKGNFTIFRPKEAANQPVVEGFSQGGSTIKPGIASDVKFGGCGSYPNLPWVSTTGSGPNGKTISGVTYKYSQNQVKIVCACHGTHMSPEEFVQHASAEAPSQENNTTLASFPSSNPAASTKS